MVKLPRERVPYSAIVDRPALAKVIAVLVTAILAGCARDILTYPDSIRIDPTRLAHLRTPQAIDVRNGLKSNVKREFPWTGQETQIVDFKQLTDNTIYILKRALQERGIATSATSNKAIALHVHPNVRFEIVGGIARVWLQLHAEFPDGALSIIDGAASTGLGPEHAFSAAIEFALNALLIEPQFVAYLNR